MLPPSARADAWNHKTKLTFNEPIELPGKVLPAGTYIFKLMDSQSDRHIVQIWNADETQIEDTVLTVPDKRLHATGKTVVKFSERPSGSPEALKAWFYPGARVGEQFVYPHDRAAELAKANKQPVFSTRSDMSSYMSKRMDSDQDSSATEMRKAPVKGIQPTGEEIEIFEIYRIPKRPGSAPAPRFCRPGGPEMAQFFTKSSNTISRFVILGAVLGLAGVMCGGYLVVRSPYETVQAVPRGQPVPFSHEHHAGGLGIDCRYCHNTVETSSFANIPATKVCMNCHSQMWAASPALQPVRESYRRGRSIAWTRVHDLPEYVYFNHSVHIHGGIGCSTCHGRVDKMPLTWQAEPLTMEWCLNCHRHPERFVRPRDQVFNMAYTAPANQIALGKALIGDYHLQSLTSCSTCHR